MIGLVDGDAFVYLAYWGKSSFKEAAEKADQLLETCQELIFADQLAIAIGGKYNFRDDLYLDYKKSLGRVNSRKVMPDWIDDLKQYIGSRDDAIITDGIEADDILRIWANQCCNAGIEYAIISHDKDLNCIEGLHLNPKILNKPDHIYRVDTPTANVSYWKQFLTGDSIDNIPGLKGIGPKKADAMLGEVSDFKELEALICKAYKQHYGEEGHELLLANGKMLHIMNHEGDYFNLSKEYYDKITRED